MFHQHPKKLSTVRVDHRHEFHWHQPSPFQENFLHDQTLVPLVKVVAKPLPIPIRALVEKCLMTALN
jgi:hypothetical protein